MNELKEIYDRITFLRGKGIKMKEMAEQAQLTPSVLSAMYSTVFPAYFKNVEKGMDDNEALDNALMWVNNLSKKKLFGLLPQMKQALFAMEVVVKEKPDSMNPFLSELEHNARQSVNHITNFSGIYTSYSLSSNTNDLKIEPYRSGREWQLHRSGTHECSWHHSLGIRTDEWHESSLSCFQ